MIAGKIQRETKVLQFMLGASWSRTTYKINHIYELRMK